MEKKTEKIQFSDLEPIFTMKGCTGKEAILDFFLQILQLKKDQNLTLPRPPLQFFHNNPSNMRNFFEILILSQNVGSFASYKKGIDTFQCEMSM